MSKRSRTLPHFHELCTGPDEDRARYHELMAKFYRLSYRDQVAFMFVFEALAGLDSDGDHR